MGGTPLLGSEGNASGDQVNSLIFSIVLQGLGSDTALIENASISFHSEHRATGSVQMS